MGPEIVVPLGAFLCAIVLAIGVPLARAYSRRMDAESRNPRLPTEVTDRLERMEHALDSVALKSSASRRDSGSPPSCSPREAAKFSQAGSPRRIAAHKCR